MGLARPRGVSRMFVFPPSWAPRGALEKKEASRYRPGGSIFASWFPHPPGTLERGSSTAVSIRVPFLTRVSRSRVSSVSDSVTIESVPKTATVTARVRSSPVDRPKPETVYNHSLRIQRNSSQNSTEFSGGRCRSRAAAPPRPTTVLGDSASNLKSGRDESPRGFG